MIAAPPEIWSPPPGPPGRPGPPLDAPPGAPGPPTGPGDGGFDPLPAAERPPSFFSGSFELVLPRTPMSIDSLGLALLRGTENLAAGAARGQGSPAAKATGFTERPRARRRSSACASCSM